MTTGQLQFEIELPVGYTGPDGTVHRSGRLAKMRGHEEALLYDRSLNAGQLATQLICRCLVRLGDLEPVPAPVAAGLTTADRNYLLFQLRRITLGDRLQAAYGCPHCGAEQSLLEDLSRFPVRRLAPDKKLQEIPVALDDGYIDRHGTCHTEVTLTLPRGVDEEFVGDLAESDPLRAQDVLTLRCITAFGSLPKAELEAYGIKVLRDLTLGDRQRLRRALEDAPGVDLRRDLCCDACGTRFRHRLDVSNFFFSLE